MKCNVSILSKTYTPLYYTVRMFSSVYSNRTSHIRLCPVLATEYYINIILIVILIFTRGKFLIFRIDFCISLSYFLSSPANHLHLVPADIMQENAAEMSLTVSPLGPEDP